MPLTLSSLAFASNGAIPGKHTCDGDDEPPPLQWTGVPAGTKSLALIMDDPDAPDPKAPKRVFVHWVLYNIRPDATSLDRALPAGASAGMNDNQNAGYDGPCPPIGRHRYFFKLYALDTMLEDLRQPVKKALEQAMESHVLEQAELVGTYERKAK